MVCECEGGRAYKVKFSGGGLEVVKSEGEGDRGILHLQPVLGQTQLHGQSSLGRRGGEEGEEEEEGEREGEEKGRKKCLESTAHFLLCYTARHSRIGILKRKVLTQHTHTHVYTQKHTTIYNLHKVQFTFENSYCILS